jgi:Ca2+-binding EF-hand superfamily protein
VFRHFDKDGSGTIDTWELQSALNQFGMKLSPHLLSLLVAKFGTLGRQHPREIES